MEIAAEFVLGNSAWAAAIFLLVISGFFSATEAALFSLGAVKLSQMEEKGVRAAANIRALMETPRRLIVTIILGNDTANIAVMVLVTLVCRAAPPEWLRWEWAGKSPWLEAFPAFVAASLGVILIGQTLPKSLGMLYGAGVVRASSYPLYLFMKASFPVRWTFRSLADMALRAFGALPDRYEQDVLAEEDIRELVEEGSREGLLDVTERELLVNLIQSGDIEAEQVMTPRHEIVSMEKNTALDDAKNIVERYDFSRFPVFENEPDKMVGIITAKDLVKLKLAERKGLHKNISDVMRPPLFVPEKMKIRDVLRNFRKKRVHLALVVDEFGAVSGLVTLEDVIEEIFGEVREDEEPELENRGEDHWKVKGRMRIQDFNTRTGARIPAGATWTLASLVLAKLGKRPRLGDEIKIGEFSFKVLEAKGIIINTLEVRRKQK